MDISNALIAWKRISPNHTTISEKKEDGNYLHFVDNGLTIGHIRSKEGVTHWNFSDELMNLFHAQWKEEQKELGY